MLDGHVKSRKSTTNVIPAEAGIYKYKVVTERWTPAFAGVTTSYGFIMLTGYFLRVQVPTATTVSVELE